MLLLTVVPGRGDAHRSFCLPKVLHATGYQEESAAKNYHDDSHAFSLLLLLLPMNFNIKIMILIVCRFLSRAFVNHSSTSKGREIDRQARSAGTAWLLLRKSCYGASRSISAGADPRAPKTIRVNCRVSCSLFICSCSSNQKAIPQSIANTACTAPEMHWFWNRPVEIPCFSICPRQARYRSCSVLISA